ncbi:MAG: hypothetical protein KDB31_08030 [Microthrixaceae bacterium]|nr:hypothetical protein [Microthrixaceae bacterium]
MAMVDFVKKIHKHCADDLEPGEQVLATTFGQPPGAIRRQVAWGALGGAVGAIAGDALANKRIDDSEQHRGEGITLQIPEGKAVLALSAQRLMVFGHSTLSGRPKGLNASIPLEQIQSIRVDQGKLAGKLVITFADGTSVDFDVVKTAGPVPFAQKFTELTGRQ